MSRSTIKTPSQVQIILEHLDRLRRMLDTACDAFDELYQHVYHLQTHGHAKNADVHLGPDLPVDQLTNIF